MRIFDKPNINNNWKCPICKTNEEKPVILCGIVGTQEGNNIRAEQFHVDCIDLYYHKDMNALSMKWDTKS